MNALFLYENHIELGLKRCELGARDEEQLRSSHYSATFLSSNRFTKLSDRVSAPSLHLYKHDSLTLNSNYIDLAALLPEISGDDFVPTLQQKVAGRLLPSFPPARGTLCSYVLTTLHRQRLADQRLLQ